MKVVGRIRSEGDGYALSRSGARSVTVLALCLGLTMAVFILAYSHAESEPRPWTAIGEDSAPPLLSETGLYDRNGQIAARNLNFVPQYPLWSDGAAKSRWVHLPQGAKIDVSDIDSWQFPVGTIFWKEFAWAGRRVETRMIWKPTDSSWGFATYVWNEEQTDATLAPAEGIRGIVEVAAGKHHSIPSVADCRSCHESSPAVVLGFNALQLSDDRDPLAPHRESSQPDALTLGALMRSNRLTPPRPDLVDQPPRIRADNPTARAAMGYLSANCGGCHNSTGPLARLGLNLLHNVGGQDQDVEPAVLTTVNAQGRFAVPGIHPDSSRFVAHGAPERSTVLYRMNSRRVSSQMPPLGTVIVDDEAVALVRSWIATLNTSSTLTLEQE